jgi:hypothetical protein
MSGTTPMAGDSKATRSVRIPRPVERVLAATAEE